MTSHRAENEEGSKVISGARICTEEQYLSEHGASRADIGDAGLHKSHSRFSPKQWKRIVRHQAIKDANTLARREELRAEYLEKCVAGELRPPTRREQLEAIALGYPDNPAVQAARRLLAAMDQETLPMTTIQDRQRDRKPHRKALECQQ